MNICSVVVHTKPDQLGVVQNRLEEMPGVEIHATSEEGKLIVTVEDTDASMAADTMMAFNDVKGVLNTILVYHYGGDESMEEEVISETN